MRAITCSVLLLLLAAGSSAEGGLVETLGVGMGDGHAVTFAGKLNDVPVQAESVVVRCGTVSGQDRNTPNTIEGHGISGKINYTTGAISVTFTTPPARDAIVRVSWRKELHP